MITVLLYVQNELIRRSVGSEISFSSTSSLTSPSASTSHDSIFDADNADSSGSQTQTMPKKRRTIKDCFHNISDYSSK